MLLHMEIMNATGPENESNKMNMNASISPYNYAFIHSPGNASKAYLFSNMRSYALILFESYTLACERYRVSD